MSLAPPRLHSTKRQASGTDALQFPLMTEQFNGHFSQDQFVIKLRGNQLDICGETRPHGLN